MSPGLTAVATYIPKREALLVQIDMSDYLIDYYLHRGDHAPDTSPEHDTNLKDLIACFAVHLSARTALETHAWTVHIVSAEPYSLFVTGTTGEMDASGIAKGELVGHVLTEHIRDTDVSSIHGQFTHRGNTHRSFVSCTTSEISGMVEQFYRQSEQHPFRVLLSETSDTAIGLVGLPGSDDEWIASADLENVQSEEGIELRPMRTCEFTFTCGCSPERLLPFFRSLTPDALEELYGVDDQLEITCPRCGKHFSISRDEAAEPN